MDITVEDLKAMILKAEDRIAAPHTNEEVMLAEQVIMLSKALIVVKTQLEMKDLSKELYRANNVRMSDGELKT